MLGEFYQDFRFCLKSLFRRPSVAIAAAVAAMALGIGASVAIFSVVNAVLLRPLPYPDADRVVAVWNHFTKIGLPRLPLSVPELFDYRQRSTSFEAIAGMIIGQGNLTGAGEPERINLAAVSPAMFTVLGGQASHGRVFVDGEDGMDSPRVTVLSDGFWRRQYGANPQVIGRDLTINGNLYTVIGIMPPGFRYPETADLWVPLRLDLPRADRSNHYLTTLGRLKPGVELSAAQDEMDAVAHRLQQDFPDMYRSDSGWGVSLVPFHEELTGGVRPALLILLVAVGLVLLVACVNVANLQLGRALARSREIALRSALGEPRGRLIRRFIAESLVVTSIGGVVGVLVAALAVRGLTRIDPTAIPRAQDIELDASVLLLAAALALVSGLVIGLVPAVQTAKLSLTDALKEEGEKSVGGRGRQRARRVLVVIETALALVLVIGAGLAARTFVHLRSVDPGFKAENTLTMQIALPAKRYSDPQQVIDFYQQLIDEVAALPGVLHAGVVDCGPLTRSNCMISGSYFSEEHMPADDEMPPETQIYFASPGYFQAMGLTLKQGRFLNAQDNLEDRGGPGSVVVDEEFARRAWPGENPIGKRMKFNKMPETPWRTVVGLVAHVRGSGLDAESREQMYVPFGRFPTNVAFLVVRSSADPTTLAGPVRGLVRNMDAELPVFDVQTMSSRLAGSLALRQFSMSLLLSLATLALFLAAVGTYSVIAYSVNQRSREIGVRMALGARRWDILRMVVGEGLIMALVGIAVGLAIAYWATQLLGNLLAGISATDIATYVMTSLLLIATAAAASYFPARKATRMSPMTALGRD